MATSRSAWKRAESGLASLFGCRRRVLSGSANRPDIDGDDATHERLFLESKLRATHTVWSLWREVKSRAVKCGKVPVLGLREKGKQGVLLVVHGDHFREVAAEYLASLRDDEILEFEAAVRVKRLGLGSEVGP